MPTIDEQMEILMAGTKYGDLRIEEHMLSDAINAPTRVVRA
jgi:hypothetical protein